MPERYCTIEKRKDAATLLTYWRVQMFVQNSVADGCFTFDYETPEKAYHEIDKWLECKSNMVHG